jgi:hypothetical protein
LHALASSSQQGPSEVSKVRSVDAIEAQRRIPSPVSSATDHANRSQAGAAGPPAILPDHGDGDGQGPSRRPEKPMQLLKPGRDLRLDLFRGLALWLIFLDHIPDNVVNWITIRNFGFSDATEIFVFISGYTAAFV